MRGKETKPVEFGAKVNNIQVDGISFIEHLSFDAFNEGIRLKECINLQQVTAVAADSIYASNANRKFCTEKGIATSFVRKGRAAKDEELRRILRSELSREPRMRSYDGYYVRNSAGNGLRVWKGASAHTSNTTLWQRSRQGTGRPKSFGFSSAYILRMRS